MGTFALDILSQFAASLVAATTRGFFLEVRGPASSYFTKSTCSILEKFLFIKTNSVTIKELEFYLLKC